MTLPWFRAWMLRNSVGRLMLLPQKPYLRPKTITRTRSLHADFHSSIPCSALNPLPQIVVSFFFSISPYYPILPRITQRYPILPKFTQCYPILHHITQYYPMLPNIAQYYPMLPNVTQYYPMLLNVTQKHPKGPLRPTMRSQALLRRPQGLEPATFMG